eukprot:TRINITY_DN81646_c0_g1_i1.p1 TRINITY_DN81646_c0_g1~~TRINITY_DN81646_c0_g1_i1.p1  ORF type:complete len:449 (-),score=79.51 TRINITY_DN81646_c0_g1_i1:326-1672(-)
MKTKSQVSFAALFVASTLGVADSRSTNALELCEKCLLEPLESDYFGSPGEPARYSNYTSGAFYKAAVQGKVMIVSDALKGAAFNGWSCEKLAAEFPEAIMRREYDWRKNPEDKNIQRLGDKKWITTTEKGEDWKERKKQDPEAPPFAPFYWGVREDNGNGNVGPAVTVEKFRKNIFASVPYFADKGNADSMFRNTEMWLGAKDTGARAHMDSHCISTLGYVLHGERRWRIGPVPRMPKNAGKTTRDVVFNDGVAYKLKWKPFFEFQLKEGEALFFPPGWLHETKNTADGCTAALVTQFSLPTPVHYYRNYYNRLRRIGDLAPCYGQVISWANLGQKAPKKFVRYDAARETAEQLFKEIDHKKAGFATLSDFKQVVTEKRKGVTPPTHEGSFLWYDVNLDGTVSREEFVDTYARWSETEYHISKEKELPPHALRPEMDYERPGGSAEEL